MKREPIERFNSKYEVDDAGCWLWTAARFTNGYGAFRLGDRQVKAHRFAYETFVGPIPDGHLVCHRCDVKRCVNPAHLFTGSQRDNIADMDRKNRAPDRRSNGRAMSKLTTAEVRRIRDLYAHGWTQQTLAEQFGVTQPAISLIVNRRQWVDVE